MNFRNLKWNETVSTFSIFIIRIKGSLNMTWVWFSPEGETILINFQGDRPSKWHTREEKEKALHK